MKIGLKNIFLKFYDGEKKVIHQKDFEEFGKALEVYFGNLETQQYKLDKIAEILLAA